MSVFQPPNLVDWSKQDFGVVRATYGTKPDKSTTEHVKRIRGAGKVVGLYHFFRADQSVEEQFQSFCAVASDCRVGPGDIIPAVDVEDFPGHQIGPADTGALEHLATALRELYGDCLVYVTQRDWHRLGKPQWVLTHPLWVAHYPRYGATSPLAKPATPNGTYWRIWQYLVGPLDKRIQKHDDPKAVDQNLAFDPLPLIAQHERAPEPKTTAADIPFVHLTDDDWEEMTAARDRRIREGSDV